MVVYPGARTDGRSTMTKKKRDEPKQRLSPTRTFEHLSAEFVAELNLPELPDSIPDRLAEAVRRRVTAFLYWLKVAKKDQYASPLEIRLVRDAHRAVLTAYELGLTEAEVYYASFRKLVEALGYERTDVGFTKLRDGQR
jgi:hypothetical protein